MAVARATSRAAAAQTHHHPVLVVSCGCHTASQKSGFESFVSGLGGFFVGTGDDAAAIPYRAAKDAIHQAGNWNPERLIQAAQCGWALGEVVEGKNTWEQQCDPVEVVLGKPPDSVH